MTAAARLLARSQGLPAARRTRAQMQLHRALDRGLPRFKQEAWRHTDPELLLGAERLLPPAATIAADLPVGPQAAATLVFVDGRRCPRLERLPADLEAAASGALDFGAIDFDEPLAAASAALSADGLDLRLAQPSGLVRIVSLITPAAAASAVHLCHRLCVSGATQLLFEHHGPPDLDYESQCCMHLEVEGDAQVLLWQAEGAQASCYQHLDLYVAAGARLRLAQVHAGGGLVRGEIRAHGAYGSKITLRQLNLGDVRRRLDSQLTCTHRQPQVASDTRVRSIAADRGKIAFDGLIHIVPGASGADGRMQLAGLLLARGAEIAAKPALLIEHDDVQCSHGATCGALDEAALHYLRSRGIEQAHARRLLLQSFAAGALADAVDDAGLAAWLQQRLAAALAAYSGSDL